MSTCKTTCPHKSVSNKYTIHGKTGLWSVKILQPRLLENSFGFIIAKSQYKTFHWLQLQLYEGWFYTIITLEQNSDLGRLYVRIHFREGQSLITEMLENFVHKSNARVRVSLKATHPSSTNPFHQKNSMYEGNLRKRKILAQHYKNLNAPWASTELKKYFCQK